MRVQRIARGYAKALVLAAQDAGALEAVREDAESLLELVDRSEPFRELIQTTQISPLVKSQLFEQALGERLHPLLVAFYRLLVEKRRERLLAPILEETLRQLDQLEGIERAAVTSVVPLTPAQSQRLQERLAAATAAQTVRIEERLDPTILGGLVVQVRDTVYDASLRAQLERLRRRLSEG